MGQGPYFLHSNTSWHSPPTEQRVRGRGLSQEKRKRRQQLYVPILNAEMGCPYRKLSVDPPYLSYELTDGVSLWKALWHQRRVENSGVCWRPGIPHPRLMKSKCCYKSIISFITFDCTTTTKQVEGGDRGYFFILPATTSLFKQRYTLAWCSCKCSTLEAVRSWDSKNTAVLEVSVVAFWTNPSPAMPASQTGKGLPL